MEDKLLHRDANQIKSALGDILSTLTIAVYQLRVLLSRCISIGMDYENRKKAFVVIFKMLIAF